MSTELSQNIVVLGANSDIGSEFVRRAAGKTETEILAVSRSPVPTGVDDPQNVERFSNIDLTREEDLNALASKVSNKFRDSFAVVHSIGNFWIHKPLVKTSMSEIRAIIESQFLTLVWAARILTPIMIQNKGGAIVAFSCNSVSYNYPDMSPFTASKAAIESFVKCYANEHAQYGISACALALPTIRTEKVLREKPSGDHVNYITPEQLVDYIIDHVLKQPHEVNGNVYKLFKHSPSFYHQSYYERNPIRSDADVGQVE